MQDFSKIPKFLYVLIITIILVVVFWLTIGQSLLKDAPKMMQDHDANVKKVAEYDEALKIEKQIEAEIKKNREEFNLTQKKLFVDMNDSTKEVEDYSDKNNIRLYNYSISDPAPDSLGRASSSGYPVMTVGISLNFETTYDKAMGFLKYIENESKGCYYINSCSFSPKGGEGGTKEKYAVGMTLTLYYYDVPTLEDTTEAPTQAATEKK